MNSGLGFGADKNNAYVEAMLSVYTNRHFIKENGKLDLRPCPATNTEAIASMSTLRRNGETQVLSGDCLILSWNDYSKYAKHHGAASWCDTQVKHEAKNYKDYALKRWLRAPERFELVEKLFGRKLTELYTFAVYDVLENGLVYYLRRLIKR